MESETSVSVIQEASNYDEISMQHSLLFTDSLKDLKNLRKQLYSAAEYFELSYCNDGQEQLVVETLKDYITKAIISTVDHLGSVAYKVNNFLDDKVDEVSGAELRFSCIEKRLRTHQEFIDRSGLSQQSLLITTPKYHKQYTIPVAEPMHAIGKTESIYNNCSPGAEHNLHQTKNAVQATTMEPRSSSIVRKGSSRLPSVGASSGPGTFSFTRTVSNQKPERRAVSPHRFPLLERSGSFIRSSIIPNSSTAKLQYPPEPWRSVSLSSHAERDRTKEIQQYSQKSKPLFKALLSMRKQKKG